ncbi:EAL domain-containing protein [Candidatus Methylobacter oryzae]|uniref:EAL domain-containing protein n=1 Tax=Candidatus Methylobacter oryzae TaxID=2497749 RepID=A0ABY3CBP6_9GAMM|nr:EAL domain-containing protein [Candidatus Methylobacter oryzae]TRW95023.1 EAL domain-containing protein [Candidatus Methylobacter oryzae]
MSDTASTNILYIEDDLGLAELVRIKLERENYCVTHAESGRQGLALIRKQDFAAVLIDFYLPDMDGLEVLKSMLALKPKTTCIMISGISDIQLMLNAIQQGAEDFVLKDFEGAYLQLLPRTLSKTLLKQRLIAEKNAAELEKNNSEAFYRSLIEHTHVVAWEYLPSERRFSYVSAQAEKLTGHSLEEWTSEGFWETCLYQEDYAKVIAFCSSLTHSQQEQKLEFRLQKKDGSGIWLRQLISVVDRINEGHYVLRGFLIDITEPKQAIAKQRLAELVFDTIHEGIMITDADNRIEIVNPAFTKITGYSFDEVRGQNPRILSSGLQDNAFYNTLWRSLNNYGYWDGELWNRHKNGEMYVQATSISYLHDEAGNLKRHIAVFGDVTEKKQAEAKIHYQANYDPLTDLPNRQLFRDRLHSAVASAKRSKSQLALLFIDLDRFKEVNDSSGHTAGDRLLIQVARRLNECIRESDTLARLGGDEFVVIMNNSGHSHDVENVVRTILEVLEQPFSLGEGINAAISASIGIALYPTDGRDDTTLIQNADAAMYRVKETGRNGFEFFTAEMNREAGKRQQFKNAFKSSLENGEFKVFFQPVWRLNDGQIISAEVLSRWQHPDWGMVMPDDFIPVAEESGFIHDLSLFVVKEVAKQIKIWDTCNLNEISVAINLSPTQFRRLREWLDNMHRILSDHAIAPHRIKLEITETALMGDALKLMEILSHVQTSGIEISLDDFGTGYSSLSRISGMPLNFIKIDRSFINQIGRKGQCNVIEAIISMAHSMNCLVIAEGIETTQQLEYLKQLGCDFGQGFLCSRPVPAEDMLILLQKGIFI